ncbi:MAG: ABC transporter ATP-binding protein [Roseiflexaceae bacterium]|nr:ABC transporter ATP-binding protein [Roseiflexaceae bacterium]
MTATPQGSKCWVRRILLEGSGADPWVRQPSGTARTCGRSAGRRRSLRHTLREIAGCIQVSSHTRELLVCEDTVGRRSDVYPGVPESLRVEEVIWLFQSYYPYTLPTEELLQRTDLTAQRKSLIAELSGGQKQRLYFALALAGDPDLLFLDEPTVGMDVEARLAFWVQMRDFAALGKTILFSTHYLEEADELASRIIVINQGRIIAEGTPSDIKQRVPNAIVRLRTNLPVALAQALPGVQHVAADNMHLVVSTSQPEAFLRAVFRDDWQVADLTVQGADLETAFRALTKESAL